MTGRRGVDGTLFDPIVFFLHIREDEICRTAGSQDAVVEDAEGNIDPHSRIDFPRGSGGFTLQ